MDANQEALELWMAVRTQFRGAGMGVIGLDYPAVYLEAERLEIELTPRVMGKIKALERVELDRLNAGSRSQKPEPSVKKTSQRSAQGSKKL